MRKISRACLFYVNDRFNRDSGLCIRPSANCQFGYLHGLYEFRFPTRIRDILLDYPRRRKLPFIFCLFEESACVSRGKNGNENEKEPRYSLEKTRISNSRAVSGKQMSGCLSSEPLGRRYVLYCCSISNAVHAWTFVRGTY